MRSSIVQTFSKLAELIAFSLSRKLPENREKRLLKKAATHNYVDPYTSAPAEPFRRKYRRSLNAKRKI
jgi:hypothetical protein